MEIAGSGIYAGKLPAAWDSRFTPLRIPARPCAKWKIQPVDVVLLDVRQSAQDGIDLLAKFKEMHPQTEIIMFSGQATVDSVVTAMKSGACDFIRKPFKGEELKVLLTRAAGRLRNSLEDRMAHEHLQTNPGYNGMLGHSPEMQKLYRIIAKVATSKHPVLVQGESGTGKETVARAIHADGPFRDRPFLLVDCASPAPGALENELFGPVKAATVRKDQRRPVCSGQRRYRVL